MREWLSGRASPCQGERREFESRLPLHESRDDFISSLDLPKINIIDFATAEFIIFYIFVRRHSQVVRHGSATPLSPVQVWVAPPEKRHPLGCLFSSKSVLRRDKSAMQMKSLRDEIAFGGYKDGFNFIEAVRL